MSRPLFRLVERGAKLNPREKIARARSRAVIFFSWVFFFASRSKNSGLSERGRSLSWDLTKAEYKVLRVLTSFRHLHDLLIRPRILLHMNVVPRSTINTDVRTEN